MLMFPLPKLGDDASQSNDGEYLIEERRCICYHSLAVSCFLFLEKIASLFLSMLPTIQGALNQTSLCSYDMLPISRIKGILPRLITAFNCTAVHLSFPFFQGAQIQVVLKGANWSSPQLYLLIQRVLVFMVPVVGDQPHLGLPIYASAS